MNFDSFQGIPRDSKISKEFQGIPRKSKRCLGLKSYLPKQNPRIPRNSKVFQVIPNDALDKKVIYQRKRLKFQDIPSNSKRFQEMVWNKT